MFDLREFILKILDEKIGNDADYKVRETALGWYQKGVLVEADLAAVDILIEEKNATENVIEYENDLKNSAELSKEI